MINFTKICPHCGEEYWGKHECEGTRKEEQRKAQLKADELALAYLAKVRAEMDAVMDSVMDAQLETLESKPYDAVNYPKHYNSHPSGVECIEVTKHYNFQIGNAMKYLWRQGLKDEKGLDTVEKQIQDCEKAIWYIQSYINDLKGIK